MENRVLALSMRPKYLQDLVGQDEMRDSLLKQLDSGRIPHFFIISGPVGAGKTTFARILALCLQVMKPGFTDLTEEDWMNYKKFDITEINAANKNGIDDARHLAEIMKYRPMPPSKAKVVILDEAHQLTNPAQQALITETEDVANHVFYIFCTSDVSKIIAALKRRAFMITPKSLSPDSLQELVVRASRETNFTGDITSFIEALKDNDITCPGLVLQATERYFSGIPELESVTFSETSKFDTMEICRAVANGDWTKTAGQLKDVTKGDIPKVRNCILGYLKTVLLKSTCDKASKAYRVAKAIQSIAPPSGHDDTCLPAFLASVCVACENMKTTKQ